MMLVSLRIFLTKSYRSNIIGVNREVLGMDRDCVKCGTALRLADITLNFGTEWKVMCSACDTIQPAKVQLVGSHMVVAWLEGEEK